jgi:hypothetical protein
MFTLGSICVSHVPKDATNNLFFSPNLMNLETNLENLTKYFKFELAAELINN